MKFTIKAILLGIVFLALVVGIIMAGFIGASRSMHDPEVLAAKPWQPMARIAFGFVMATFTLVLGGALIRAYGNRV